LSFISRTGPTAKHFRFFYFLHFLWGKSQFGGSLIATPVPVDGRMVDGWMVARPGEHAFPPTALCSLVSLRKLRARRLSDPR
jgi:hypothetical protein